MYEVKKDAEGKGYLVFNTTDDARAFDKKFEPSLLVSGFMFTYHCFDGYYNALRMEKIYAQT